MPAEPPVATACKLIFLRVTLTPAASPNTFAVFEETEVPTVALLAEVIDKYLVVGEPTPVITETSPAVAVLIVTEAFG